MTDENISGSAEYTRNMQRAVTDIYERYAAAADRTPIAVVAVCPPAGITASVAIGNLRKIANPAKGEEFAIYNPTHTREPSYVTLHKLDRTRLPENVAVEYMGPRCASSGYLCLIVPPPDYNAERVEKADAVLIGGQWPQLSDVDIPVDFVVHGNVVR